MVTWPPFPPQHHVKPRQRCGFGVPSWRFRVFFLQFSKTSNPFFASRFLGRFICNEGGGRERDGRREGGIKTERKEKERRGGKKGNKKREKRERGKEEWSVVVRWNKGERKRKKIRKRKRSEKKMKERTWNMKTGKKE